MVKPRPSGRVQLASRGSSFLLAMSESTPIVPRKDPFKDSLWRFLGYANEVGEAVRPLVPVGFVWSTYVIAIGYAAADTYDKASYEYEVRCSA